jgi:putative FmdB family regulatory protein
MPLYDYVCRDCKKRFDVFMSYADYGNKSVKCSHCQSTNITRRINKIRIAKSDDSRLEGLSDPAGLEALDEDPKALGRMLRKMKDEVGGSDEMPAEFDEVVGRLEAGQSPQDIERDLPELANDDGGMGDMSGLGGMDDF